MALPDLRQAFVWRTPPWRRLCRAVALSAALAAGPHTAPSVAAPSDTGADAPENQKESDWMDARWSRTDFGNFEASILPLPNGTVAKGLTVRVGEHGEAALVYDTASLTLRAGWTDGFLKFSGARYGLIQPPQPAFCAPTSTRCSRRSRRWSAAWDRTFRSSSAERRRSGAS